MTILITGACSLTEAQKAELEALGCRVVSMQREHDPLPIPPEEVDGVIGNGLFLYHPIEYFSRLRYVQLTSAGCDRVPVSLLRERGITVHTARGVYDVPMAEFAVWAVLHVYKEGDFFRDNRRNHRWEKHRGLREIHGARVCIVGCGGVGNACAERFGGFGCAVCGVDRSVRHDSRYAAIYPATALRDTLREADVVILALPLTPETYHIIGRREMESMREGSILVNLARGGLVDTEALIDVLTRRPVTAVLDVQETEPLPQDSPLWDIPNVYLTPHNSFVGDGNGVRLWETIRRNMADFLQAHDLILTENT